MGARLFACVLACGLAAQAPAWAQPQPGELVERTLALVAGQVITLSDARAAIALGLVDRRRPTTRWRSAPACWWIGS